MKCIVDVSLNTHRDSVKTYYVDSKKKLSMPLIMTLIKNESANYYWINCYVCVSCLWICLK